MPKILASLRLLRTRLRQRRALRRIERAHWGASVPLTGDVARFGEDAIRLSRLSMAGIPVQPSLVLDANAILSLRSLPTEGAIAAHTLLADVLGTTEFLFCNSDGLRRARLPALGQALADATAPLVIQAGASEIVRVTGRVSGAPGQWSITAGNKRGLFGRLTWRHLAGDLAQIDAAPLGSLLAQVESVVGSPCEITVTRAGTGLQLGSCQPLAARHPLDAELDRLVGIVRRNGAAAIDPAQPLFRSSQWSEQLPLPTPVTLDLLEAMSNEDARAAPVTVLGLLMCVATTVRAPATGLSRRQRRRQRIEGRALACEMRRSLLPQYRTTATLLAAVDLTTLTASEVLDLWHRQRASFLAGPQANADRIAAVRAQIESVEGSDAPGRPRRCRPQWQQDLLAARQLSGRARAHAIDRIAGHRASLDYELAQPRYRNVPGALDVFVLMVVAKARNTEPEPARGSAVDLGALAEDARHEALRYLDILRRILLDLDRRYALGGKIFELDHDEIATLSGETVHALRERAAERQNQRRELSLRPALPQIVTAAHLERLTTTQFMQDQLEVSQGARARGNGRRISGRAVTTGRAYVVPPDAVEFGADLVDFRHGDIIVTPRVHPAWRGLLASASGVVCEFCDDPAAKAAMEYGIAMVIDVPNAGQFRQGDRLTLHADGRVTAEIDVGPRLRLVRDRLSFGELSTSG